MTGGEMSLFCITVSDGKMKENDEISEIRGRLRASGTVPQTGGGDR